MKANSYKSYKKFEITSLQMYPEETSTVSVGCNNFQSVLSLLLY